MPPNYDIKNVQGRVRLLISDIGGKDGKSFIFEDDEVQAFLDERSGAVKLAAADALRTIAGNEAQVQKRITFLELKTDGPAVAKELNALAASLEKAYRDSISDEESEEDSMEIADMNTGGFAERDLIEDRYLL